MSDATLPEILAFDGDRLVASGAREDVAAAVDQLAAGGGVHQILAFEGETGRLVDLDVRVRRPPPEPDARRGPGRPKLGVVAREVTLLPRHWDWLNAQPGGASVALRKLVDEARKANGAADGMRAGREAVYRFMTAMAGDRPGYEEACRLLFAGDSKGFSVAIADWPNDVRDHLAALATRAFGG